LTGPLAMNIAQTSSPSARSSTPSSTPHVCIPTLPSRTWPNCSPRPPPHQLQGAHLMSAYGHGRHEHGQNFLTDHKIINSKEHTGCLHTDTAVTNMAKIFSP